MLKRLFGIAALGLLMLPAFQASAQTLKVGYTDHELLIVNMPEYQQVQEQLKAEYEQSQGSLQTLYQGYQEKLDRYQKQQALLSEERRKERENELVQAQQEIQQKASESEQKLAEREGELLKPLFERVDTAIKTVAREKGLDIVLRSSVGPVQPIILYVNEKTVVDITPDVARKLGLKVDDQASN